MPSFILHCLLKSCISFYFSSIAPVLSFLTLCCPSLLTSTTFFSLCVFFSANLLIQVSIDNVSIFPRKYRKSGLEHTVAFLYIRDLQHAALGPHAACPFTSPSPILLKWWPDAVPTIFFSFKMFLTPARRLKEVCCPWLGTKSILNICGSVHHA